MRYFVLLMVVPMLWMAACGSADDASERAALDSLRVEDFHYAKLPGGARIITGRLHNPSGAPIKNAQIQISLFDRDNRFIETMHVLVKDVPPVASKPFRQAVDGDAAIQRARVRSVLVL